MKFVVVLIIIISFSALFAEGNKEQTRSQKFEILCAKNNYQACFELGLLKYRNKDIDMAKKYYEKACTGEELRACNNLGNIIRKDGNLEKAEKLFKKACDKNNQTACHNQQFLGEVLRQNKLKASCELDDNMACLDLGRMYLGLGKIKSAKKVFQGACDKKMEEACKLLEKM